VQRKKKKENIGARMAGKNVEMVEMEETRGGADEDEEAREALASALGWLAQGWISFMKGFQGRAGRASSACPQKPSMKNPQKPES